MNVRLFLMFAAGVNFDMLVSYCGHHKPVLGATSIAAAAVGFLYNFILAWKYDTFTKPLPPLP